MAKSNKVAVATQVAATPTVAPTLYNWVGSKRPLTGIKYNTTAAAAQAIVTAQGGKPITLQAAKAACTAMGNPGFAAYAVRNGWLAPAAQ
jgi:hypothetical protein